MTFLINLSIKSDTINHLGAVPFLRRFLKINNLRTGYHDTIKKCKSLILFIFLYFSGITRRKKGTAPKSFYQSNLTR
jgi:hypothetical protein